MEKKGIWKKGWDDTWNGRGKDEKKVHNLNGTNNKTRKKKDPKNGT